MSRGGIWHDLKAALQYYRIPDSNWNKASAILSKNKIQKPEIILTAEDAHVKPGINMWKLILKKERCTWLSFIVYVFILLKNYK